VVPWATAALYPAGDAEKILALGDGPAKPCSVCRPD
jgi:hypothetical protein